MPDEIQFAEVLLRLLQALVDHKFKRSISIAHSVLPGRVNWDFTCDVDALKKIVGKRSVRLRALRLIVEVIGRNAGQGWFLSQPHNLSGERAVEVRVDAEIPDEHDTRADFELLRDLLLALEINAPLAVSGSVARGFRFVLVPALVGDNVALLDPHTAVYSASQIELQPLNLIGAIGSLMRAIGAVQGVRYEVGTGSP